MSDPSSVSLLEVFKTVPDLIKEVYGDLAKPGAIQAGKAIGSILKIPNILLGYIDYASDRQNIWKKKNLEIYREKVSRISIEKTCEVPPEIGVPIMEKLSYTSNEDIANLFTELLSKASTIDTISEAHPSYIQFISMLSPDEAKIIRYLGSKAKHKDFIPFVFFTINNTDHTGFIKVSKNLTGIELKIPLMFKDNISLYLDNLESLGILRNESGKHKQLDAHYELLYKIYPQLQLEKMKKLDLTGFEKIAEFSRGFYEVTQLGKSFIDCCTTKTINQLYIDLHFVGASMEHSLFKVGDTVRFKNNPHYNMSTIEWIISERELCIKNNGRLLLLFDDSVGDLEKIQLPKKN